MGNVFPPNGLWSPAPRRPWLPPRSCHTSRTRLLWSAQPACGASAPQPERATSRSAPASRQSRCGPGGQRTPWTGRFLPRLRSATPKAPRRAKSAHPPLSAVRAGCCLGPARRRGLWTRFLCGQRSPQGRLASVVRCLWRRLGWAGQARRLCRRSGHRGRRLRPESLAGRREP